VLLDEFISTVAREKEEMKRVELERRIPKEISEALRGPLDMVFDSLSTFTRYACAAKQP